MHLATLQRCRQSRCTRASEIALLQMAGKEVQICRCNLIECTYTAKVVDGSAEIEFPFSSVDASLLDVQPSIPEEANAPSCDVNDGVAEAPAPTTTFYDVTNEDQEETMFTRTMEPISGCSTDKSPNTSTDCRAIAAQQAHSLGKQSGRDRANAGMCWGAADASTNSWRPDGIEETMFSSVRNGE